MNIYKKVNIILFVLAIMLSAISFSYYKLICSSGSCSYDTIKKIIIPLETGGYILAGFFLIFLFLSATYFKNWFKYVFSWGFPLVVYLTWITTGSSSIPAYGKVDIVRFWGVFFGVVTVLFVVVNLYLDRRKNKN
jgi:hypothetical protein